jgi:hypothetical protein
MRIMVVAALLLVGCSTTTTTPEPRTVAAPATSTRMTTVQPTPTPTLVRPPGVPILNLTPGSVISTSATDVCSPGWAGRHRVSLTRAQERAVLAAYHAADPVHWPDGVRVAEWDHYFAIELGGGNTRLNIWPQVSAAARTRKDKLENALHRQVCVTHTLTLAQAQAEISKYWVYW